MRLKAIFAGASAGLALAAAMPAAAQSIDYGSLEQLFNEPVTTSATGSPQRASQAPVDMDIISAQDIKRSGATDLPTILSRVAGIDVLNWSAGTSDVGVRGYNAAFNPRLLVLVNGRQVYLDFYGYTAWSALPVRLEEIRQIEVVKGPNAALFGFNAVSGVINIITYNPHYDDKGFATANGGSHGYGEGSLGHTFKLGDRFAARVTGGYSRQDEFGGPVTTVLDPVQRLTANLDTVTQLADKLQLRVEAGLAHSWENSVPPNYAYLATKYLVTDLKGTVDWDTKVGALQASGYQNRVSAKFGGSVTTNKIEVFSLQDLFKIGADHTFRISAEYRKTDLPLQGGAKFQYDVRSAGAMWNWQLLPKVALTAAARYDDLKMSRSGGFPPGVAGLVTNALWDRSITIPSYNAGVVWAATGADTFRATYARGAQTPSLTDLGYLIPIGPGMIYGGSPTVEPTIVTNYGVSYDRALPQIGGSASVRLFYQKSRDIIGQPDLRNPDLVFPIVLFTYANVSDSDMRGVEAVAKGSYKSGVRWQANYTYTDVKDHGRAGYNLVNKLAAFEQTTPKHRANLNVGWDNAQWSIDGFLRYQSKLTMSGVGDNRLAPVAVDGFATLAGRVARKFDHGFTLSLNGENLTNDRQKQTSSLLQVERRIFVSLNKTW